MFVHAQLNPLFAAGFDWLEAVLPLLFVIIWLMSQVVAFFRRVGGGAQARVDQNENETDPQVFLEERVGGRQCKACGTSFVAPLLAIVECPECGRLTPPEIDGNKVSEEQEVNDSVEAEISAFLNRYIQTKQPTPVPNEGFEEKTVALPISEDVGEPKKEPMSRTLIQQDEDRETQPREEDEISRHIHEVFDQGLNHLPDGIVENPWSDLRDKTEKAVDPSIKKQTEEATDFSVAAMLKDPVSRKQLFILREVLDRPQNLWE